MSNQIFVPSASIGIEKAKENKATRALPVGFQFE
jgi:hypothetical protein